MEIRVLKYFLTVAREQNITRAAETLHMTQPTLSRQLAALEDDLGTKLFNKSGRKIMLTEEGILLKRRALEILELEEKTVEELRNHDELIPVKNLRSISRKVPQGPTATAYGNC